MIKMYEQVPQVYLNASRDFQYLSRLIDVVLNGVKYNIDGIYSIPNCPDNIELTELLAFTLGFKIRRNYDKAQLAALVSILPTILKYKGTQTAIDLVGRALIKSTGTAGTFLSSVKDNVLEIILPKDQVDTTLFIDLLPYILPAGMSCKIIKRNIQQSNINTETGYESVLKATLVKDYEISKLYPVNINTEPDFHNILGTGLHTNPDDPYRPNIGLMHNNIIPVLTLEDIQNGIVSEEDIKYLYSKSEKELNSNEPESEE